MYILHLALIKFFLQARIVFIPQDDGDEGYHDHTVEEECEENDEDEHVERVALLRTQASRRCSFTVTHTLAVEKFLQPPLINTLQIISIIMHYSKS